jgi:hypothetical protein
VLNALVVEQNLIRLCIGFFLTLNLEKEDLLTLSQGFFDNFQNSIPPIFIIEHSTTKINSSRSKYDMGTFRSSNPSKTMVNIFKSHTYVHISKIKDEQRVKQDKHHERHKF